MLQKTKHSNTPHMKKLAILAILLFFLNFTSTAHTQNEPKPFIEITGTSEIKINPDQIFISIKLEENTDKSKKDIIEQEENLIKALQSVGISTEKLVVTDANAFYGKSGFLSKDMVNTKEFELEVKSAKQAKQAFEQMDKLNIKNAYISRVDHSQMEEYKKKAKIKAIQEAKEKATYLLVAVGEKLGGAIIVRENAFNIYGNQVRRKSNTSMIGVYNRFDGYREEDKEESELDFKKITLTASIYVKWEIAQQL
jgi:hypothetical protein